MTKYERNEEQAFNFVDYKMKSIVSLPLIPKTRLSRLFPFAKFLGPSCTVHASTGASTDLELNTRAVGAHIPFIPVGRTKESQECGQIVR